MCGGGWGGLVVPLTWGVQQGVGGGSCGVGLSITRTHRLIMKTLCLPWLGDCMNQGLGVRGPLHYILLTNYLFMYGTSLYYSHLPVLIFTCAMCHVPCAVRYVPCAMCCAPCAMCYVACAMCHVLCAVRHVAYYLPLTSSRHQL